MSDTERKGRGGAREPAKPGASKDGIRRPRGPNGKWSFTIDLGPQPAQRCNECRKRFWVTGRMLEVCPDCGGALRDTTERRQETRGGFATRDQAISARDQARVGVHQGSYVARSSMTLAEYLEERWLPTLPATNLKGSTIASYRSHVKRYLAPTKLGRMQLGDLNRDVIAAHYAELREHGRVQVRKDQDGKPLDPKPLATSTIERIHASLHRALRDAVRSKLLPGNPADDIDLARGTVNERTWWDSAQLRTFLESVRDDRLKSLWLLYSTTGARRGELLALRWADVDLQRAKLKITRSRVIVEREVMDVKPKTKRGTRTISLDPASVGALREQKKAQVEDRLRARDWTETDYIFTDESGRPLHPNVVTKRFDTLATASGLPRITVHGLRHTAATIMLNELRKPVSQVSQRLGHANESITLAIYSHAIEKQDETLAVDYAAAVVPDAF